MIKYNNSNINDWYFYTSDIVKVYRNNAVCYYKITTSGGTPSQTPCYAVVDDISQYSDTEFEDVFNKADEKWYKLNNLNQYEQYGIYGSGRTITYYEGKLTVDNGYEYEWNGSSWVNLGEVSGSSKTSDFTIGDINDNVTIKSSIADGDYYVISYYNHNNPKEPRYMMSYTESNNYLNNFSGHTGSNSITPSTIIDAAIWKFEATSSANTYYIKNIHNNLYWGYQRRASTRSLNLVGESDSSKAIVKVGVANSATTVGFVELNVNGSRYTYEDGTVGGYALNQLNGYTYRMNWWNTGGWGSDGNSAYYLYKIEGGTIVYPVEYDEMQDPPNNLVFASMAEAEEYECPWVGMNATIDGTKYIFSGDSQSGYEWVEQTSRLPQGYTEVEYIRNSNYNAYINTGVILFDNTTNTYNLTTRLTSEFHSNLGCATIIACEALSSPYNGLGYRYKCSSTVDQLEFFGGNPNYNSSVVDNGDGTRTVTFQSTGDTTWTLNTPLIYFANWASTAYTSTNRPSDATIYSATVVKNGVTVRDFVPARRDSDSKYGLYDLITDTFYTSPNGNNFIGGNPV